MKLIFQIRASFNKGWRWEIRKLMTELSAKSSERLLSCRFLLSYNIYTVWVSLRKMN